MRAEILAAALALAPAAAAASPFDGTWTITVSCPDAAGAMGYSYQFSGEAKGGMLHAERMRAGEPGWLVVDGPIQDNGQARLYTKGLVGAAPFAVGARPKGTPFGYHVDARFDGDHGTGHRVEGRPCTLDFDRR